MKGNRRPRSSPAPELIYLTSDSAQLWNSRYKNDINGMLETITQATRRTSLPKPSPANFVRDMVAVCNIVKFAFLAPRLPAFFGSSFPGMGTAAEVVHCLGVFVDKHLRIAPVKLTELHVIDRIARKTGRGRWERRTLPSWLRRRVSAADGSRGFRHHTLDDYAGVVDFGPANLPYI